ncbi:MAG: nucleotidyltransferase family protein [Oscillospiraceae bacterium]|nr:nucleotidyltransferase family protein [Oscillospiraceae bacterium]
MKIGAIICEYNPFHNGHKYHIEKTRERFDITHLIAVMSGNFTQRGDIAVLDKWQRAKVALDNGIDLVIELPVAFSLTSAEQFAMGAVTLLNKLNCVETLSFGSESGDIELLCETAGAVHYCMEQEVFRGLLRRGESYPAALQKAVAHYYEDEIANALATPNNTLGIEYIKALDETGSSITPVTVKRFGAQHDTVQTDETANILSGSQLRDMLLIEGKDITPYVPKGACFDNIADIGRLELAVLSKLRGMSSAELLRVPNMQTELERRLSKALKQAKTLNEVLTLTKTKSYTMARIRRAVLNAFLGISKADLKALPAYIRVLGMNQRGREILNTAQPQLPTGTSLKTLSETSQAALNQAELENRCSNQYSLCFNPPRPCGTEYSAKPIVTNN